MTRRHAFDFEVVVDSSSERDGSRTLNKSSFLWMMSKESRSTLNLLPERRQMEQDRLERQKRSRLSAGLDDEMEKNPVTQPSAKKQHVSPSNSTAPTTTAGPISSVRFNPCAGDMRFQNGALRLTRTPGRGVLNTITLGDLIDPEKLQTAFIASFFIAQDELFQYLPFERFGYSRPNCIINVSRDLIMDELAMETADIVGMTKSSLGRPAFDRAVQLAKAKYKSIYGANFNAIYPYMKGGCSHTKLMVLVYEPYVRVVITSANLMVVDTEQGDNHWFIQDFPRFDSVPANSLATSESATEFETQLFDHITDLGCPALFIEALRGSIDFASANARIVVSKPGSFKGAEADLYGQLRLRRIVREVLSGISDNDLKPMAFEVCVGSVGKLEAPDMLSNLLESCSGGRQVTDPEDPPLRVIFPTRKDVLESTFGEEPACNIGCHIRWKDAPIKVKRLLYHYRSKDPGMLFHMKLILAYRKEEPNATPFYIYCGSHNFSAAAWGKVCLDKSTKASKAEGRQRLEGISNYDCGVVIGGEDIVGMLETDDWEDLVPYVRPSAEVLLAYDIEAEKPWNSPTWVTGR